MPSLLISPGFLQKIVLLSLQQLNDDMRLNTSILVRLGRGFLHKEYCSLCLILHNVLEKLQSRKFLMCVCVAQCEVGALCSVKKGPRFGQLCDCHKGSRCNYVFLKCL
uniref:Uncharacterized protein n=1 Tax=Anabas testudineus TaxID=64144 RepID=A0A3Q1IVC0_ANATE